jgi:phage tail-like protein
MDVQGSEYHLINGPADWSTCVDVALGRPLGEVGAIEPTPELSRPDSAWEYDHDEGWLRMRRDTPLFRQVGRTEPMDPAGRRGAGRDGYGNWYWIDTDRRSIRWRPVADNTAALWWSVDELHQSCNCLDANAPVPVGFRNAEPCPASGVRLSGLTVSPRHYLVCGYVASPGSRPASGGDEPLTYSTLARGGDGEQGLLLFDLQAGGAPLRLVWPADEPFAPLDLADLPDGGVLVLDAEHSCYWRLDEHFRVRGEERTRTGLFVGTDGSGPLHYAGPGQTTPYPLVVGERAVHPVSIEPGPDGSVLVLESNPAVGFSVLFCFAGEELRWVRPMKDIVEVIDPDDPNNVSQRYSLLGYDFVYAPVRDGSAPTGALEAGPLEPPSLYVADSEGNQVVAFRLDPATGELTAQDDFLPLRRWAGRALVRAAEGVWYDYGEHWIPLAVFTECRFASQATLVTAPPIGDLPGEMFDSQRPGCVWHRLILDAYVPTGTAISIRARAADDLSLLEIEPWLAQPIPYQRGGGSELPWADPWADPRERAVTVPAEMGSYEVLFQQVTGRYLQLEITVSGGGRSSAAIRSVRAWFPRFSYVEHYLPAVYAEHDAPVRFLERFLANPEGLFTALEEKIEHSHLLLDHRTARSVDLAWLASWFGLVLDPLWTTERRRFLIGHVDEFYRRRGTAPGLLAMLRVFFDKTVDDASIFAVGAVPATSSRIRLLERFLTRPHLSDSPVGSGTIRTSAHRFDVQVPGTLTADQTAMVERIVEQNKPAHTAFSLTPYEELFVVGKARLGLDTELAYGLRFSPAVLGSSRLGRGYLAQQRPFDIPDRIISDRDRIDHLPAL